MRLLGRHLGTYPQHPAPSCWWDEAMAVRGRLGHHEVERTHPRTEAGTVRVVDGPSDDPGHVRAGAEKLREDDGLEDDVAVKENEGSVERLLGAEQGVELARLREPVIVDEANPRCRHLFLPVAADHDDVADAAAAERRQLPFEDGPA